MCVHTRRDKIKYEDLQYKVGVNSMVDKMREARLKWFGHVKWRYAEAPMSKCGSLAVMGFRRGVNQEIKRADPDKDKKLNIMRGFFFCYWLILKVYFVSIAQHLTRQDAFQPWEDAECLQTKPGSS
ncbi:hypothetical protein H5410_023234 [Solanum commersonii]|uniref:Reverse transcriptase n=1 Tax=Solanum commersonii TaxID=4109 RepID=A0A9J5ZG97_SOLCO|nr:hypothetical protein H5410_023234 [Solanum commersonii]